jgi:hypothetical protein
MLLSKPEDTTSYILVLVLVFSSNFQKQSAAQKRNQHIREPHTLGYVRVEWWIPPWRGADLC